MHVWLDDVRDPRDPDIQRLFGSQGNEVWVKNPYEAIDALLTGEVTSMSFDNDLGWPEFQHSGDQTNTPPPEHPSAGMKEGYQVLDWLEEAAYHGTIPPLTIQVHSANTAAAQRMKTTALRCADFWKRRGSV